jgi:ribulose-phosphate 3-epimerase
MMTRPDRFLEAFAAAGVDSLTFHVEADVEVRSVLAAIRGLGLRCGLSLKPGTNLARIRPFLADLDLVLVMSVEPGFGGQSFLPGAVDKIRQLDSIRFNSGYRYAISVDGGVDADTAVGCREAGADILVSGTYLFAADDRPRAVRSLRPDPDRPTAPDGGSGQTAC